jgi:CHASE2 domain-containing sensor protein
MTDAQLTWALLMVAAAGLGMSTADLPRNTRRFALYVAAVYAAGAAVIAWGGSR